MQEALLYIHLNNLYPCINTEGLKGASSLIYNSLHDTP